MAGSLAHILNDDGTYRGTELLNTLQGDGYMALAECHQIIAELLEFITLAEASRPSSIFVHGISTSLKPAILRLACDRLGFPVPTVEDTPFTEKMAIPLDRVVVPVIQPDMHGYESVYRPQQPKEWLIWSNEHAAWWRPGRCGYTQQIEEAGLYSRNEADAIVAGASNSHPVRPGTKSNEMSVRAPVALLKGE